MFDASHIDMPNKGLTQRCIFQKKTKTYKKRGIHNLCFHISTLKEEQQGNAEHLSLSPSRVMQMYAQKLTLKKYAQMHTHLTNCPTYTYRVQVQGQYQGYLYIKTHEIQEAHPHTHTDIVTHRYTTNHTHTQFNNHIHTYTLCAVISVM